MKNNKKYIVLFVLLIGLHSLSAYGQKQGFQAGKEEGIALYKKGEYRDAMNTLARISKSKEAEKDAEFWNYLGLSYLERDNEKNALKSLEKAVKVAPQSAVYRSNLAFVYLMGRKIDKAQSEIEKAIAIDPQSANAYYIRGTANLWERKHQDALADAEKAISVNNKFSPAYMLKADVLVYEFGKGWTEKTPLKDNLQWLAKAQEVLEICEKDCAKDQNFRDVQSKLDSVRAFHNHFKKKADYENGAATTTQEKDPNHIPMKILTKHPPRYTDRARRNNISGSVSMAVVFSAEGKITQILVLKGLGYGLDEEAMIAARKITFEPETDNGKPVSVVKLVEYGFAFY